MTGIRLIVIIPSKGRQKKAAKAYDDVGDKQKNHVFLGLNSICDLTNNNDSEGSQKSLFNERTWKELKNEVYVSRNMPEFPENIERKLIKIEEEAVKDIKKAYRLSLTFQEQYAFSQNEFYFEVYSHILRLLGRHNSILNKRRNETPTEQDYVGQVWTPIMSSVFNDPVLLLKWGVSVPQISSEAKRELYDDAMGDRMDMGIMTKILNEAYDVSTGEYTSWLLGPTKFSNDHRKVLRESKVILDSIINCKYTSQKEAKRMIMPCFQASGLDGELNIIRLATPGLYTVQYIGSIPIPYHATDLDLLRTKCLPRLIYMKKHALKNVRILSDSIRKEERITQRKSSSYKRSSSYDSDTEKSKFAGSEDRGSSLKATRP